MLGLLLFWALFMALQFGKNISFVASTVQHGSETEIFVAAFVILNVLFTSWACGVEGNSLWTWTQL